MHEYEQLKALIIGDEQKAIETIHQELRQLQSQSDDPKLLFKRIAPHFSALLTHCSTEDTRHFKNAVIHAAKTLLEQDHDGSYDVILEKLSPLIYNELRRYIKEHKERVTDLLYPVVGSMISKYVSQMIQDMMNDVNEKIQNGLSFENFKRKITAKVKGVHESELLLYEVIPVHVKAVLLIHKQMGAVISHRVDSQNSINEPEMVASMLTALTDFINNWIDKQASFNEVNEINYGSSKIYLEASGHSYLAVLIEGHSTKELKSKTHDVLENILESYAGALQEFQGDLSSFNSDEIETLFDPLFDLNLHVKEKKHLSKWPLVLIASLFVGLISYFYYLQYDKEQFKSRVLERIRSDEHLALYAINASWHNDILSIDGRVPSSALKKRVLDVVITKKLDYEIKNNIIAVTPLIDYDKTRKAVEKQLELLNSDFLSDLDYEMNNGIVTLHGQTQSPQKFSIAVSLISRLDGVKSVLSDVISVTPERYNTIYFPENSSVLQESEISKIEEIAFWLKKQMQSRIDLVGYASKSNNINANNKIAKERAFSIKNALLAQGIETDRIGLKWMPYPPFFNDGNSTKARCVKFYWYNMSE